MIAVRERRRVETSAARNPEPLLAALHLRTRTNFSIFSLPSRCIFAGSYHFFLMFKEVGDNVKNTTQCSKIIWFEGDLTNSPKYSLPCRAWPAYVIKTSVVVVTTSDPINLQHRVHIVCYFYHHRELSTVLPLSEYPK